MDSIYFSTCKEIAIETMTMKRKDFIKSIEMCNEIFLSNNKKMFFFINYYFFLFIRFEKIKYEEE